MKVGNPHPVARQWNARLRQLGLLRLLVSVVSHDKAEEEAGHDDVPQAQHGEVSRGVGGGEDQLAGQGEVGSIASHGPAYTTCSDTSQLTCGDWRVLPSDNFLDIMPMGFSAGLVATLTITLALKTY